MPVAQTKADLMLLAIVVLALLLVGLGVAASSLVD